MAQPKVIKIGRVVDKWLRLLTYLQGTGGSVYRLTFPSTEMSRKASHSFREILERHSYLHLDVIHRGEVCWIFKPDAVQDVQIVDE